MEDNHNQNDDLSNKYIARIIFLKHFASQRHFNVGTSSVYPQATGQILANFAHPPPACVQAETSLTWPYVLEQIQHGIYTETLPLLGRDKTKRQ